MTNPASVQGIGRLMHQPQFVYRESRTARAAARYYRPIIYGLTTAIILLTIWRYLNQTSLVVITALVFMWLFYTLTFIGRLKMSRQVERKFYHPAVQLMRGQLSLWGLTGIIGILELYGLTDHNLWILYVLATLIISEHNKTRTVLLTLLEVAVLYFLVSYLGWSIFNHHFSGLLDFSLEHQGWLIHTLGIWLVTFVFHYLVRNIHGRDRAFGQHQKWLNVVAEQWSTAEQPAEQRQALLNCAQDLTGAHVDLWWPSVPRNLLVSCSGKPPDKIVQYAANSHQPLLLIRDQHTRLSLSNVEIQCQPDLPDPARMLVPVSRLDDNTFVGMLDLRFSKKQPDEYTWEQMLVRVIDLSDYMRFLMINNQHNELLRWENRLIGRLGKSLDIENVINQILSDVVEEFGFDLATVSLVDPNEKIIRCEKGLNANWVTNCCHSLFSNDVQALVVREKRIIQNNGELTPYLDRRIWSRHNHRCLARVWVPILGKDVEFPLGTIEAGFRHKNRRTVPQHLVSLLAHYAEYAGTALANAFAHNRQLELSSALQNLHDASQEIQRGIAFYEPHQMVRLIGKQAEEQLGADLVVIYTLTGGKHNLRVAYMTPQGLRGRGRLRVSLTHGILHELYQNNENYFSGNARFDGLLVNLDKSGRLDKKRRTFTQRQNIKSFAGIRLVGKHGNLLGFLCLNYRRRQDFYPEKRQIIELFARQAAVALEETNNHRSARTIAIAQERQNIAAELHHTISQNLFSLNMYARSALQVAENKDLAGVGRNLDNMYKIITQSQNLVGEMLSNLNEQPQKDVDFVNDFLKHQQFLKNRFGLSVVFEPVVKGSVPQLVQFYLLRIVHEALNNVLRHARTKEAVVRYLVDQSGYIMLSITDDGRGFDVQAARRDGSNGLNAMDFFASRLNTQINIFSDEESGTCIIVHVAPPETGELIWEWPPEQAVADIGLYGS